MTNQNEYDGSPMSMETHIKLMRSSREYKEFLLLYEKYIKAGEIVAREVKLLRSTVIRVKEVCSEPNPEGVNGFDPRATEAGCDNLEDLSSAYLSVGKVLKNQSQALRETAIAANSFRESYGEQDDEG